MKSARIGQALSQPLDALIVSGDQVLPNSDAVNRWRIPEGARTSLTCWGLPIDEETRSVPNYQEMDEPEVRVESGYYYALGIMGNEQLGVLEGVGSVWGIPLDPEVRGGFFNSSVEAFVDISWRWYGIRRILAGMAWDIAQYDEIDVFLDYVLTLDPAARIRSDSLWVSTAESW